ncbi:MFS general substrate transporter [Ascobolus immersus RN42]|uniref:MFS general substrate transporter n=1 Tax=Ascobolus immersus RN42 TaxID=1160509 RepID=A0A3N4IMV5_ASCIM|nr:MFS general substrate transporter [Ascobolus immersus RN42]
MGVLDTKDISDQTKKSVEDISESSSSSSTDLPVIKAQNGANAFGGSKVTDVFEDADLAQFYEPCAEYEGRHRFDPTAQWTEKEEKQLVRKLDLRICAWCCLMFFALQLDRGNIAQALSDNMLDDLGFSTNNYNTGQTIFYLCFLCAELPSQLISKWLGPDNWIPIQMVCWSIVAICQCRINSLTSFYVTRGLLGLIEGGFIPDVILYLTYFYKTKELPVRLSYFWTAYNFTGVISAFLAFGILRLRGHNGWEGWRWLFALEGGLTACIGIISYFYLPPSPTQTASWFRGKDGWFSEREEVIMVTRILRDDPSKGDMHNRQYLTLGNFWSALKDYDMWPIYLIGICWLIPSQPMSNYLTLTLRSIGFDTFQTNLLVIPSNFIFIAQLIFWTWVSEKINQRLIIGIINCIWLFPLLIALKVIPDDANQWVRFVLATLVTGHIYAHAVLVALTSRNAGTVRTRTVASAIYNMFVQAGSIISSNIYRTDDKPYYRKGNTVLIAINAFAMCLFIATIFYYKTKNARREAIWSKMTKEERKQYLSTTKDEGNKRLDFRFIY